MQMEAADPDHCLELFKKLKGMCGSLQIGRNRNRERISRLTVVQFVNSTEAHPANAEEEPELRGDDQAAATLRWQHKELDDFRRRQKTVHPQDGEGAPARQRDLR